MVGKLSSQYPQCECYREGDYSPVELAWCAYVKENRFLDILGKYPALYDEITGKTVKEGAYYVIPYTRILTDIPGFHKDLEQYEIYNGNRPLSEFQDIIKRRYSCWKQRDSIFECSLFQNIIEAMILFYELEDLEIIDFYKELGAALEEKTFEIIYLEVSEIRRAQETIRRERCDEKGNEMWFPLMTEFIRKSPYGRKHGLHGMDGLVTHLERRVQLEKRILREVFDGKYSIVYREVP